MSPLDEVETSLVAQLAAGRTVDLPTSGGSMFPFVRNGDVVRVRPPLGPPRVGQVVLAVVDGRWVLHRVVSVTDGVCVLRGDNRRRTDPGIGHAAVVGVAVAAVHRGLRVPLEWPDPVARAWIPVARAIAAVTPLAERIRRRARGRRSA